MTARDREGDLLAEQLLKPPARIYPTGLDEIDSLLKGGLRSGEMTLLGGFSGHAKSALAEQIALYQSQHASVLYLPLEMGEEPTRLRMGAKIARCDVTGFLRTGMDPLTRGELNARLLTVHKPKRLAMDTIEQTIRRANREIVVVDHVRHIEGVIPNGQSGGGAHRIAHQFASIAESTGSSIILLQQLDPKGLGRPMREWRFQDSTAFYQAANTVLITYRPFEGYARGADYVGHIIARKNRWGRSGMVHYRWVGETMSYWPFLEPELEQLTCCKRKTPVSA
jgi:replicative DNA helicase